MTARPAHYFKPKDKGALNALAEDVLVASLRLVAAEGPITLHGMRRRCKASTRRVNKLLEKYRITRIEPKGGKMNGHRHAVNKRVPLPPKPVAVAEAPPETESLLRRTRCRCGDTAGADHWFMEYGAG